MNELKSTKNAAIIIASFTFLSLIVLIFIFIKIFDNENLRFNSYELDSKKEEISNLNSNNNDLKEILSELQSLFFSQKELMNFDRNIRPSDFKKANGSVHEAEKLIYSIGFDVIHLDDRIGEYNKLYRLDQFVYNNFEDLSFIFFELNPKYWNKDLNQDFNFAMKETLERLSYTEINYSLNLDHMAVAFNEKLIKKTNDIESQIRKNEKDITTIKDLIVIEEKRLENVEIRNTSLLISKGITVIMAIVVLLTLLAILKYTINLYNKSQVQFLLLSENDKETNIEVLKLLAETSLKFENKAEEFIGNLGKKN